MRGRAWNGSSVVSRRLARDQDCLPEMLTCGTDEIARSRAMFDGVDVDGKGMQCGECGCENEGEAAILMRQGRSWAVNLQLSQASVSTSLATTMAYEQECTGRERA